MQANQPSGQLVDLAHFALDHAIGSIERGGPLIPFAIVEADGERVLRRFAADTLEEGEASARAHLGGLTTAARAVLARDAFITAGGERTDAIIVEAQESGMDGGVIFAQRYRPGGRLRKLQRIGDAAMVGDCDPLWG